MIVSFLAVLPEADSMMKYFVPFALLPMLTVFGMPEKTIRAPQAIIKNSRSELFPYMCHEKGFDITLGVGDVYTMAGMCTEITCTEDYDVILTSCPYAKGKADDDVLKDKLYLPFPQCCPVLPDGSKFV